MARHWVNLLTDMATGPDLMIGRLLPLAAEEKQHILGLSEERIRFPSHQSLFIGNLNSRQHERHRPWPCNMKSIEFHMRN